MFDDMQGSYQLLWMGFASEVRTSHLETVSTVRGSGWVKRSLFIIIAISLFGTATHPLPRTVLTVSKCDLDFWRQSLFSQSLFSLTNFTARHYRLPRISTELIGSMPTVVTS
jgi:hypothetical protein